jgi:hypothetical protein
MHPSVCSSIALSITLIIYSVVHSDICSITISVVNSDVFYVQETRHGFNFAALQQTEPTASRKHCRPCCLAFITYVAASI